MLIVYSSTTVRSDKSRALVLHPRSLELLSRHGVIDAIVAKGTFNNTIRIFCNQKQIVEVKLHDTPFKDTVFPHPLMISQADTESILDDALAKYGKRVERTLTAVKMEQDEESVTAWLQNEDGSEMKVRCKYVVGCDGAHSVVRKFSGLKFEGDAYAQDFILADVRVKWDLKQCLHVFIGGQGFLVAFPIPMQEGLFRLICSRPLGVSKDTEPTLDDFKEVLANKVPGVAELSDPVWITKFALHHRIANNYRSGRMFIAGDAAHIHSPAGGQGMNTGIQDAANLGWKLASVLKGEKDAGLLDSYHIERHKVGQKLLQGTDRMFEYMATTNRFYLFLRNNLVPWILPFVMSNPTRRANRFRFVSQLGIRYRDSPIVGKASNWTGKVQGGDRAPNSKLLDGNGEETTSLDICMKPGYHLLLFAGEEDFTDPVALEEAGNDFRKEENDEVGVHYIVHKLFDKPEWYIDPDAGLHRWYGFKDAGFALVRPDGHVAFIGPITAMEELKAWMKN
jgi:2-polyprenyl-6-methoxyphenol hydroxylase-like FAD-dependent oxidoreductase